MPDSMKVHGRQTTLNRGYLHETGVEPRDNEGARSTFAASNKEKNDREDDTSNLLEQILDRNNLNQAFRRVKANKGSHGVDGMTVDELLPFLKQYGQALRESLLVGEYTPHPVRRAEMRKPDGGGTRLLGIPTVLDRMIQQAMAQVLSPVFDLDFSENSYGFRPGRNAHQAVNKAKDYIAEGYTWVVDFDLASYFDTVNHDILMALVARKIKDKRVLKLIRLYLQSGVMINGVVVETSGGCPQGGPLSPLLSNIMLDELDKELAKRGHRFCRYADDSNVYVRSWKAGERVMASITRYLEDVLKLRVNKSKSAVDRPWSRKFLGFSFYRQNGEPRIRVHERSIGRLKEKLRKATSRRQGISMEQRLASLTQIVNGWINYYHLADMKSLANQLDKWVRRRLRMCYWKQWKKIRTKHDNLVKLGVNDSKAWEYANTRKGYWRISNSPILATTLTNNFFRRLGYKSLSQRYAQLCNS